MNRNQIQSSFTDRNERVRPLTRNSDVLRGIERWENEGGRIRMDTTGSDGANRFRDSTRERWNAR
jgi:hypothetical protein